MHCWLIISYINSIIVNVGEDCPVFEGLFEFCSISAGGSIGKIQRETTNFYRIYP